MIVDHTSLLLAAGISGVALSFTMTMMWLSSRTDGYLLSWACGAALMVAGVLTFSVFAETKRPELGMLSYNFLAVGFAMVLGAAVQFRTGRFPAGLVGALAGIGVVVITVPLALGLSGVSAINLNLICAAQVAVTASIYWSVRDEAPLPIGAMAVLYGVTSITFLLCALVLITEGSLVLDGAPANWAEDLNAVMCIVGITGIGALSLALNQSRLARRHRADAMTDALTGLLNRRALFDRFGAGPLAARTAVIVLDLDQFKLVNDKYGHAVGDLVLQRFASAINENLRPMDGAARLGGEEFAVVLPRANPVLAALVAERIRALFESDVIQTDKGELRCTVSAGVSYADADGADFDVLLRAADSALYQAKNAGRNQVSPGVKLVA